MALLKDTGALGLEATWSFARDSGCAFRPKLSGSRGGSWGSKDEALSKRRAGNWLAAASEASLASGASSWGGNFLSVRDMALEASGMDTDPAECEPELVRITSMESEANSEALVRLFGRAPTIRRGALPSSPPSLFAHSPSVTSPERSPTTPLPVLCEDGTPFGSEDGGAEPSPRDSLGSASSGPGEEAGGEAQSALGCHVSSPTSARLGEEGANAGASQLPREDPTCTVDPCSWSQLSLEAILGAETGCPREAEEVQELSPRDVLASSLLDLISDPAVKAKIRSLQLFTGVDAPCVPSFEGAPLPFGGAGVPSSGDQAAQRLGEGFGEEKGLGRGVEWGREEEEEEEGCESPESEGSPPPLARSLTVKREAALEDCWLTGSQRRRKAAAMMGVDEDGELDFGFKRRRVFGREQEL